MGTDLYEILITDPTLQAVFRELGRRMSFGKVSDGLKAGNFDAKHITVTFQSANAEHQITHGLSRTPVGMLQVTDVSAGDALGVRLEVTKAANERFMYMKSEEARSIHLMIW